MLSVGEDSGICGISVFARGIYDVEGVMNSVVSTGYTGVLL